MSGTGESTGDFDDDQRGNTSAPAPSDSAGTVFAQVAGATAMPEEVPAGPDDFDDAANAGTSDASTEDAVASDASDPGTADPSPADPSTADPARGD